VEAQTHTSTFEKDPTHLRGLDGLNDQAFSRMAGLEEGDHKINKCRRAPWGPRVLGLAVFARAGSVRCLYRCTRADRFTCAVCGKEAFLADGRLNLVNVVLVSLLSAGTWVR
jgi:hypothetical protein